MILLILHWVVLVNILLFLFSSVSLIRPTSCGTTSLKRGLSRSRSLEGRTRPTPTSTKSIPRSNTTSMEWRSQVRRRELLTLTDFSTASCASEKRFTITNLKRFLTFCLIATVAMTVKKCEQTLLLIYNCAPLG